MHKGALPAMLLVLSGCASSSDEVTSAFVSPTRYEGLNCQQIASETELVSHRVRELSGAQDKKAERDMLVTGAAILVFWPAAPFLAKGDGQTAKELSQLKGEFEALRRVSASKNCNHQFRDR